MVCTRKFKALHIGFVSVGIVLMPLIAIAQQNDPCDNKNTQAEMNSCEAQRYASAEAGMNGVYKQLLAQFKSQQEFVAKLTTAQQDWIKFRDADVESFYNAKDKLGTYGSVYPMCRSLYLIRLTNERTRELEAILNGNDNDVCGFVAVASASHATLEPGRCPRRRVLRPR